MNDNQNLNIVPCRWGDDCKFDKNGMCPYYHDSKQEQKSDLVVQKSNIDEKLPNKFKILSQNIWCILFIGGSEKQKRLQLLIENIKNEKPDIICFQELFLFSIGSCDIYKDDVSYVDNELNKLGYIYKNKQKESFLFGLNSGLMMYSKYTFKECQFQSYDKQFLSLLRKLVNKGLIAGIFKMKNNESFLLVNTHFENKDKKTKQHSINSLCNYLKNHLKCNNANYVLCCGDFNICSNGTWELHIKNKENRLYYTLSKQLSDSCGLHHDLCVGQMRTMRKSSTDKNAIYDHLFVNDNLNAIHVKTQVVDWKQNNVVVSDHYGVMAYFDQQKGK